MSRASWIARHASASATPGTPQKRNHCPHNDEYLPRLASLEICLAVEMPDTLLTPLRPLGTRTAIIDVRLVTYQTPRLIGSVESPNELSLERFHEQAIPIGILHVNTFYIQVFSGPIYPIPLMHRKNWDLVFRRVVLVRQHLQCFSFRLLC